MSNKYEDLIKNARMNADCGEYMSPAEVTTLLNVVETTFAALAGEVYDLKHPGTYLPSKRETPATDAFLAEVRASGVEMFAAWNDKHINPGVEHKESLTAVSHAARGLAYQIRKGVQS
ncbi:hypothetical protein PVM11_17970 [Enterobacter roggenkampii]|uniref:hypothetical protein n=1 Tax=Enterobacter roggenkampii TaxID=1812935 RepID=UPI0023797CD7|nr:hypothetical protein [Enterobacter roggenkampii]MDD9238219.1 hypothetical protein [Enterobacter roggenkampii]MDD9240761.1 hypothetical protein [Enterobacter roggenkampii]